MSYGSRMECFLIDLDNSSIDVTDERWQLIQHSVRYCSLTWRRRSAVNIVAVLLDDAKWATASTSALLADAPPPTTGCIAWMPIGEQSWSTSLSVGWPQMTSFT